MVSRWELRIVEFVSISPTTEPRQHSPSEVEVLRKAVNIAVDQTTSIRKVEVLHLMTMLLATVDMADGRSVVAEVSAVVVVDSEASIGMDHRTVKAVTNGAVVRLTVTTSHADVPVLANPVLTDLDHARHVVAVRRIPIRTRHRAETECCPALEHFPKLHANLQPSGRAL